MVFLFLLHQRWRAALKRMRLAATKGVISNASQGLRNITTGDVEMTRKTYSRCIYQPGIFSHVHKDWSHCAFLVVPDENAT